MKFSCLQENLAKALNVTNRIISARATLPVLGNVLLSTEKGRLKISSTNLEIGLNYMVGAKVEKEGSLTVPARLFTDYISSLSSGKVSLETKDNDLIVQSGKAKATIKGIEASEFPLIPKSTDKPSFSITAKDLFEGINLVSFSAAIDESRPVLSGVLMDISSGMVKLVATDSYRLSEKKIKIKGDEREERKIIVPSRSMQELARALQDISEDVDVFITENQIFFKTSEIELTSRLIDGNFPAYEQIIPGAAQTKALISKDALQNIARSASLFAREAGGSAKLIIRSGELELSAETSQVGQTDLVIDAKTEGPGIEVSFNIKYFLDLLAVVAAKEISLEFSDKLSPVTFKAPEEKNFLHIIMPLRS